MSWTFDEMKAECRGVMRDARRAASQGVVLAPIAFVFANVHEQTGAPSQEVVVVPCNSGRTRFIENVKHCIELTRADGVVIAAEAYIVRLEGGNAETAADLLKRAREHKLNEDELRGEGISVVLDTKEQTVSWQASIHGEEGKTREVSRFVEGPDELGGGMVEFFEREGRTTVEQLEQKILEAVEAGCNAPSAADCPNEATTCDGCQHQKRDLWEGTDPSWDCVNCVAPDCDDCSGLEDEPPAPVL